MSEPYVARMSALEPACEWRITPDGLWLRKRTEPPVPAELVPWEIVTAVRLRDASSEARDLYVCEITLSTRHVHVIPSSSFVSFATFEQQGPAYRAFLRELHAFLPPRAPGCTFHRGDAPSMRIFHALMLLLGAAGLVFIVWIGTQSADGIEWSRLLLLVPLVLLGLAQFKANRSGTYDPRELPAEVMPGEQ